VPARSAPLVTLDGMQPKPKEVSKREGAMPRSVGSYGPIADQLTHAPARVVSRTRDYATAFGPTPQRVWR